MSEAKRDLNYVTTLIGVSINDLSTPVLAAIDPTTNRLLVQATFNPTSGLGTTSTITSVGDSASSVTLLASNTSRIKAVINNDSSAVLYIKEGSTASTTSYSYKLSQDDVAIIDDYNGIITGIWASDAGGSARITETT